MVFEEQVKKQIGFPESNRLKYEALLPSNSEIARNICAFANTEGGILVFGILSKYNKITVKGLSDDFRVETVVNNALSKLNHLPKIDMGFIIYDGKKLFAIQVDKCNQPVTFNHEQYVMVSKKITKAPVPNIFTNKIEVPMTNDIKLDKILIYLIEHPERINVNKHTVEKMILNDGTSLSESGQLVEKLKLTNYVRSYGQNYIGVSIDAKAFIEKGGFSGIQRNISAQSDQKKIFLSYNWNLKEAAQKLYDFLKLKGYAVDMDDHNLIYKDKISTFMESIRSSDFSILLISDEYLKSENCMTEVLHLLKDRDFQKKLLPVRDTNLKIFSTVERIKYIEYWKLQVQEREALLNNVDLTSAIEELRKLKTAKHIHQNIGDFLAEIADMITYKIEDEEGVLYNNILNYIGRA
ncbi:TIR domain-containing protein [Sphingobacterium faecium]|uniref:TIR domain-containing protein n=1 Tax=Sphingobacterium faecium TaxID=34087 RepID=UPI002479B051|nr:TIR domain-containing protein [Sphingobacterium faecium]WGQ13787.1 TIR domain-containing protein [Sphingobacterium faecium]